MDILGAIAGPLLAIGLIALVSIRTAIFISVIPGLLSAIAIIYAIRRTATPKQRRHQRIRITVRPLLRGPLGRLMIGMTAFEIGNCATTLLILRASQLFATGHGKTAATQIALLLYIGYNIAGNSVEASIDNDCVVTTHSSQVPSMPLRTESRGRASSKLAGTP